MSTFIYTLFIYYYRMLSRVVKEHQERQVLLRDEQEKKKRVAIASVQQCTSAIVDSLNEGVERAYENQRKLDKEAKTLQGHSAKYVKQTTQWLHLIEGFHKNLKGLGDLEQWARTIEGDMQMIVKTLEYAYQGTDEVHVISDS